MVVGYMPKARSMMPSMPRMPRMSVGLAVGTYGTSDGGVIWQGWRLMDGRQ